MDYAFVRLRVLHFAAVTVFDAHVTVTFSLPRYALPHLRFVCTYALHFTRTLGWIHGYAHTHTWFHGSFAFTHLFVCYAVYAHYPVVRTHVDSAVHVRLVAHGSAVLCRTRCRYADYSFALVTHGYRLFRLRLHGYHAFAVYVYVHGYTFITFTFDLPRLYLYAFVPVTRLRSTVIGCCLRLPVAVYRFVWIMRLVLRFYAFGCGTRLVGLPRLILLIGLQFVPVTLRFG